LAWFSSVLSGLLFVIRPDARHDMTLKERTPIAKTRFLVSGGWSNFLADREFAAFVRFRRSV
jgi:hypothetical protein